jgi:hypothetical protein
MKIPVLIALFVAATSLAWGAERHAEPAGNFSYIPPEGWSIRELPGLKYKVAAGLNKNQFTANLSFVDEAFPGSLAQYVAQNETAMQKGFEAYKLLSKVPFDAANGLKGTKVVVTDKQGVRMLRQVFYFFDLGRSRKMVATCSMLLEDAQLENRCDESLHTLTVK